jgi:hypothetical protein
MRYVLLRLLAITSMLFPAAVKSLCQLSVSIEIVDTLSCAGMDGELRAEVTGGIEPYTFKWHGPDDFSSDSQGINGLYDGTYFVTVTDKEYNQASDTIEIYGQLSFIFNIIDTLTCYGADGTISIIPVGGTPGYTVTWTKFPAFYYLTAPHMADTIFNVTVGKYTVEVTDEGGCTVEEDTIIAYPAAANVSAGEEYYGDYNIRCNGENNGQIIIVNPYEVMLSYRFMSLDTAIIDTSFVSNALNITLDSLCAGVYLISHTNSKGCIGNIYETLTEPDPVSIIFTNSDSVYTGQELLISPLISGGMQPYSYQWNTGEDTQTITDTLFADKSYSLTITDSNGCTDTAAINVKVYTPSLNLDHELYRLNIYPNPVKNYITVEYMLTEASGIKIELIDIDGRIIKSLYENRQPPGFYSQIINFDQSGINSGLYILKFTADRKTIYQNIFITIK